MRKTLTSIADLLILALQYLLFAETSSYIIHVWSAACLFSNVIKSCKISLGPVGLLVWMIESVYRLYKRLILLHTQRRLLKQVEELYDRFHKEGDFRDFPGDPPYREIDQYFGLLLLDLNSLSSRLQLKHEPSEALQKFHSQYFQDNITPEDFMKRLSQTLLTISVAGKETQPLSILDRGCSHSLKDYFFANLPFISANLVS